MRVALLSHSAPAGDAIGRQIAEKVACFLDRGADVRVFVESDRRLHPALRPYTHRYSPAEPRGESWRFLSEAGLIVVEYSQYFPLLDLLPLISGGRPRVIFDYHGVTPPEMGLAGHRDSLVRGCRLRGLAASADAAIVHSRFSRGELTSDAELSRDRVHSLGYPLDLSWFSPGSAGRSLRSHLGLPGDVRLLLFVGRLAPNKRVSVLVEALAHLREQSPPVHAVIVGDSSGGYSTEHDRCRERAARLGVADRVHFFGHVDEKQLRDAYRDADALVIPSVHEGFCIPAIEAMACGTPVIVARAAALPETIADAGLTFVPDDAADLARKILRLWPGKRMQASHTSAKRRVAVVAPRFGSDFVGGAESSLRTLALSMADAGYKVEVFTLGTSQSTSVVDGLPVHRFRADPVYRDRHAAAAHTLRLPGGLDNTDAVEDFLHQSPRSKALIESIQQRGPFDAVIVGPYLPQLTRDVAEAFGDRVLLAPCLHDEPFARLPQVQAAFEKIGGVLYHSEQERRFAEAELGLNQPNARILGALIDADSPGDAQRGRELVGTGRRFVLYCGRYCREKGLTELLAFARRYANDRPDRFTFAFIGEGDEAIPVESWACDLAFVSEANRRDLMAGADALLQLSANESLSLVTVEALAQGTPVIARGGIAVLEEHAAHGGGVTVDGYEEFAAALDDLWTDPNHWRAMGRAGREYVRRTFANSDAYKSRWQSAIDGLDQQIDVQLLLNGLNRVRLFNRSTWREQFSKIVDSVLDSLPRSRIDALEIVPRTNSIVLSDQQVDALIPVRLTNRGQHAEAADGPGRTELIAQLFDAEGESVGSETITPLPGLLVPGRSTAATVCISVPSQPGEYQVSIGWRRRRVTGHASGPRNLPTIRLTIEPTTANFPSPVIPANLGPSLRFVHASQQLPQGYVDVSEGRFASLKRWVKHKLLHNFQTAYVDVLARQQSAFNGQVVTALSELGDGQSALAHAVQSPRLDVEGDAIHRELQQLRRHNRRLRKRLKRLEDSIIGDRAEEAAT